MFLFSVLPEEECTARLIRRVKRLEDVKNPSILLKNDLKGPKK